MGPGSIVGNALLEDPRIRAVSFTGSVQTGHRVATACAARGAKFQLEMGGKNPLVVLNDANMDVAVDCAVNGAFYSTGQRCTASSRLIVEDGIHDRFVDAMIDATRSLRVGNAIDETTQIGPVVDQAQFDRMLTSCVSARPKAPRWHRWGTGRKQDARLLPVSGAVCRHPQRHADQS